MRIGVVGNPGGWSSERLADALERRTGYRRLIDPRRISADLDRLRVTADECDLTELDAIVLKKIGWRYSPDHLDRLELLRLVAARGVRVFSCPERILRVLDRLSCTTTLRIHQIPMPATVITEDIDEAVQTVRQFGKAVFKPLYSTKARGMCVIEAGDNEAENIRCFRDNGNKVLYIQQMVSLPGRDLGLAFLGGSFLGAYARVNESDEWNTTTNFGGRYAGADPSPDIIELARRAQEPFGLDFTSVDVAETDDGPIVFEVSAFGGFRGLQQGAGVDAAERYAQYVVECLNDVKQT